MAATARFVALWVPSVIFRRTVRQPTAPLPPRGTGCSGGARSRSAAEQHGSRRPNSPATYRPPTTA